MSGLPALARRTLAGLLRVYRLTIGALLPPLCRFEPSCSRYAEEAILRHGVARGCWRTAGRLLRCHPFHPGGLDPVD